MTDEQHHEVITLLEDAAAARRPLVIELRDGRQFCDGVCDLRRAYGEEFVVFHAHNRMLVRDIVRAEPTSSHERDDVECIDVAEDASGVWCAL
jgi:hypothetical protein